MPNLRDEASNQLNSLISRWGCESPLTWYIPPGESLTHTFLSFLNLTDQLGTIAQVEHLGLSSFFHVLSVIIPFVIRLTVYATKRVFFFILFHSFILISTSLLPLSLSPSPYFQNTYLFLSFSFSFSAILYHCSVLVLSFLPLSLIEVQYNRLGERIYKWDVLLNLLPVVRLKEKTG